MAGNDVADSDKSSGAKVSSGSPFPRLERMERVITYLGAAGLGLGHGLIPQLLLLITSVYRLIADPESRKPQLESINVILLALTGWMMLSSISAIRPLAAFGGAFGIAISGWVTMGVVRRVMLDEKGRGRNLISVFLGSASAGAIYALANYASALSKGRSAYRAALPFAECNAAGTVFCVAVLIAWGCFRSADRRGKLMVLPVIVLLTAALVATQSRGAFVAFLVGFLVFLMLGVKSKRNLALRIGALAGLVLIVGFFFKISPSVAGRYARILNPMANKDRLEIWRTALLIIKEHPVLGVGVNNFVDAYPLYEHPEGFVRSMFMAHNILLEFGATTGIPGLILFLVAIIAALSGAVRCIVKSDFSVSLPVTALAVFVAILTHLQFDITLNSGDMLPFFFIPFGVVITLEKWLALRSDGDFDFQENI